MGINENLQEGYSAEEFFKEMRKQFTESGLSEYLNRGEQRDPTIEPGSYQVTFLKKKNCPTKTNRKSLK